MSFETAIPIANAVLYEGYILYPYRPSSVKNRQRWTFGGLFPRDSQEARSGSDPSSAQTDCLLRAMPGADLSVRVRFLHLIDRQVARRIMLRAPVESHVRNPGTIQGRTGESDYERMLAIQQAAATTNPPGPEPPAGADAEPSDATNREAVRAASPSSRPGVDLIGAEMLTDADVEIVPSLTVCGRTYRSWQEAIEREVSIDEMAVEGLVPEPRRIPFAFGSSRTIEPLRDEDGSVAGAIVRTQRALSGAIDVRVEALGDQLYRVRVRVENIGDVGNDAPPRTTVARESPTVGSVDSESLAALDPIRNGLAHPAPTDERAGAESRESRDVRALTALVAAHIVLDVVGGEFVSVIDPPEELRTAAKACTQEGLWPVLVGEHGSHDTVLASPVILYDYPEIAAESPGDLFDGTEIDEILTLRILTLTEQEKREMRESDERAAALLDRTERLRPEQLMKLHGVLRQPRSTPIPPATSGWEKEWEETFPSFGESIGQTGELPGATEHAAPAAFDGPHGPAERASEVAVQLAAQPVDHAQVGGVDLRKGDRVRLRPKRRADVLDMLLEGRLATVESIQQDYEERVYLAVTIDDDPGRDLGDARQPGHRFFYAADEVEPVERAQR